jgi:hypothetical protein
MIDANRFLGGFARGTVFRREDRHFVLGELSYINSVAENLEMELVAIKEQIGHIEGRLKDVAEKWEFGKSARPS